MSKPMTPVAVHVSWSASASPAGCDESVVARAVAGELDAVAGLLRAIRPSVIGVVRRVLGACDAEVDDAVQHALIGFVQALPAYRGDAGPAAYAKTIALRSALAFRRRYQSVARRSDDEDRARTIPSDRPSPNDDLSAERRRALLRRLLGEIPMEQAEALAMRAVLGWSLEEIARHTGAPLNTVRSRLRLAKEALRRKIEEKPSLSEELSLDE